MSEHHRPSLRKAARTESWRISVARNGTNDGPVARLDEHRFLRVPGRGGSGLAEIFDVRTARWTAGGPLPAPRLTLVRLASTILAREERPDSRAWWSYDAHTERWQGIATSNDARYGSGAAAAPNGALFVAGGTGRSARTLEQYDSAADRWRTLSETAPNERFAPTVLSMDDAVLVLGGQGAARGRLQVDAFDLTSGTWRSWRYVQPGYQRALERIVDPLIYLQDWLNLLSHRGRAGFRQHAAGLGALSIVAGISAGDGVAIVLGREHADGSLAARNASRWLALDGTWYYTPSIENYTRNRHDIDRRGNPVVVTGLGPGSALWTFDVRARRWRRDRLADPVDGAFCTPFCQTDGSIVCFGRSAVYVLEPVSQ